jgi:hypothetical protein
VNNCPTFMGHSFFILEINPKESDPPLAVFRARA